MSLPPEKASELKQIIHNHLLKMDIHGKIREVLAETVREDQGPAPRALSEADFLHALQRRGIIDDVMKDLHFTQVAQHLTGSTHRYRNRISSKACDSLCRQRSDSTEENQY